jgi:hypothetical protein
VSTAAWPVPTRLLLAQHGFRYTGVSTYDEEDAVVDVRGRWLGTLGILIVAGALAVPATSDAAAVACQRKKRVKLRDGACKAKETQVMIDGTAIDTATLPQVPSAATADTAASATDADTLDGIDGSEYSPRVRWALVASDGSEILAQSGGITLQAKAVTGIYVLDFAEDLLGRAALATVRGGLTNTGWAQVAICGAPDAGPTTSFCNVPNAANTTSELAVATVDETGAGADRSFYVVVFP